MSEQGFRTAHHFLCGEYQQAFRHSSPEARFLAIYLLTNPYADRWGSYYLPKPYLSHDTGLTEGEAGAALSDLVKSGFCSYDPVTEYVWVHGVAGSAERGGYEE